MIEISGDMLEGGGQIVRTSLALAALTGIDIRIARIRHKRPNPGLQPQHVTATRALAAICNAQTDGLRQGSTELEFRPHQRIPGKFQFDVGTAGSIPLILQALMPCIAFAPGQVELKLTGGTDVKWSPSVDYVSLVMLPTLRLMGYHTNLVLNQRGHYPKGGGIVTFSAAPTKKLQAITLIKPDQLNSIEGVSHCVKLPSHVAQRQLDAANRILSEKRYGKLRVALESQAINSTSQLGPGSGITLVAKHTNGSILGADSLGERGKPAEKVGEEAAKKLIEELESDAAFDRHMGDILIPYMAVADGHSEISVSRITMHTLTNIHVAETLLNINFQVNGNIGEYGTIAVNGIGLTV